MIKMGSTYKITGTETQEVSRMGEIGVITNFNYSMGVIGAVEVTFNDNETEWYDMLLTENWEEIKNK